MTHTTDARNHSMSKQITMGAGLVPPQRSFDDEAPPVPGTHPAAPGSSAVRRLLVAAGIASPVLFTAFVAVDPGPLPREPAADFLGAIAAHPGAYVAATTLQVAAMATGIALAVAFAVGLGGRFPKLAGATSVALVLGCLGGTGFAGGKLVAADLVEDGRVRPGAEAVWSAVHGGPLFDVMSWPLVMAILGNLLLAVLLLRWRDVLGLWPAAVVLAGFVMSSGEFPDAVTLLGSAIQVPAVGYVLVKTLWR